MQMARTAAKEASAARCCWAEKLLVSLPQLQAHVTMTPMTQQQQQRAPLLPP